MTELKSNLEEKADAARLEALEDKLEEIRNKSRRNNLVFFNGIGADFAKKTQDKRKALLPFKKHLQEKLGQDSKVFISYPATLKYVNEDGTLKIVKDGDWL